MIELGEVVLHLLAAGGFDEADGLGNGGVRWLGLLQGFGNGRVRQFQRAGYVRNGTVRK